MNILGKTRLVALIEAPPDKRHEIFDFSCFNNNCGTTGCLAGDLLLVFPESWGRNWMGIPVLRDDPTLCFKEAAAQFFDISAYEARNLFYPRCSLVAWDAKELPEWASRDEVVAAVRQFISWKETCEKR